MLKPYYTCGHVMCFNSAMAIEYCIHCGCKIKNKASFCCAFHELLANDDDKQPESDKWKYKGASIYTKNLELCKYIF